MCSVLLLCTHISFFSFTSSSLSVSISCLIKSMSLARSDSLSSTVMMDSLLHERDVDKATATTPETVQHDNNSAIDSPTMSQNIISTIPDESPTTSQNSISTTPDESPATSQNSISATPDESPTTSQNSICTTPDEIVNERLEHVPEGPEAVEVGSVLPGSIEEHDTVALRKIKKAKSRRPIRKCTPPYWRHGVTLYKSIRVFDGADDGVRLLSSGIIWSLDNKSFTVLFVANLGYDTPANLRSARSLAKVVDNAITHVVVRDSKFDRQPLEFSQFHMVSVSKVFRLGKPEKYCDTQYINYMEEQVLDFIQKTEKNDTDEKWLHLDPLFPPPSVLPETSIIDKQRELNKRKAELRAAARKKQRDAHNAAKAAAKAQLKATQDALKERKKHEQKQRRAEQQRQRRFIAKFIRTELAEHQDKLHSALGKLKRELSTTTKTVDQLATQLQFKVTEICEDKFLPVLQDVQKLRREVRDMQKKLKKKNNKKRKAVEELPKPQPVAETGAAKTLLSALAKLTGSSPATTTTAPAGTPTVAPTFNRVPTPFVAPSIHSYPPPPPIVRRRVRPVRRRIWDENVDTNNARFSHMSSSYNTPYEYCTDL